MGAYSTRYITKSDAIKLIEKKIKKIDLESDDKIADILFDLVGKDKGYNFWVVSKDGEDVSDLMRDDFDYYDFDYYDCEYKHK